LNILPTLTNAVNAGVPTYKTCLAAGTTEDALDKCFNTYEASVNDAQKVAVSTL
jgi:hypothetical protein